MFPNYACLVFSLVTASAAGFLFDREKCYGDLGCFKTETIRSFSRPIVLLPDDPANIDTKFFLYTRQNRLKEVEQELTRKDLTSVTSSNFDSSKPTKIIIHSYLQSAHDNWVQLMKDELLNYGDYNIIAVDWRAGAGFPFTQATANIRVVAAELAKLIEFLLRDNMGMSAADIHIIGHSLGAHAASEVGTKIRGLGRISGLDPAEPYFEGASEEVRLEKRDAEFVDVIHTDGSAFLGSLGMGYRTSIGHVDYFPNGGAEQPGCDKSASSKLLSSITSGLTSGVNAMQDKFGCSHNRAIDYYIESINGGCPFTAYPCKSYDDFKSGKCLSCLGGSCSRMGFHSDQYEARGEFYLLTHQNGSKPHCSYHYKVSVTAGVMADKGYGQVSATLTSTESSKAFGPFPMSDEDNYIESKSEMERIVLSSKDLGDITAVGMSYTKDDCLTCFLYSDFIRLQHIQIYNGERQQRTTFCGKNTSLATKQYRKFAAESSGNC